MNILLINCPVNLYRPRLPFSWSHEPLNICYAAGLISAHHTVKLIDFNVQHYQKNKLLQYIKEFAPSILGFSCTSPSYPSLKIMLHDIGSTVRRIGIVLVAGGSHPSSCPEMILQETCLDIVVQGEGESIMKNIVDALLAGKPLDSVRGIFYIKNGNIFHTEPEPLIENLDSIPFPPRHLMQGNKYRSYSNFRRFSSILSSRGCPFSCIYCYHSKTQNKKVRYRSAQNVYQEMKEIKHTYGISCVHFIDDHFTLREERIKELCELLIKHPLDTAWVCQGRTTCSSYELYALMKKAGCQQITFGIESGDEAILSFMKKKQTLAQVEEGVRMAKKANLKIRGNFIIGFPVEDEDSLRRTISFARSLQLDRTSFFLLTPYPHSILWDYALEKGFIARDAIDWNRFTQYEPFFTSPQLDAEKLSVYLDVANIRTSRNIMQLMFYYLMSNHKNKFITRALQTLAEKF